MFLGISTSPDNLSSSAEASSESFLFASSAAFAGLTKKLLMLVIVALAVLVDRLLGTQGICRMAAIGFYAANEGLSIIENCSRLGVPFPQSLMKALERLRQQHDDSDLDL